MKYLIFIALGLSSLCTELAADPKKNRLDSLKWELSLSGCMMNSNLAAFKTAKTNVSSLYGMARITRKFEEIIQMQFQVRFGTLRLNETNDEPGYNNPPVVMYGSGLILNFAAGAIHPFFNFGFGAVSYGKGRYSSQKGTVTLDEQRGNYSEIGIGVKLMDTSGIGIKVEGNYLYMTYPSSISPDIGNDHIKGLNVSLGVVGQF